MSGLPPKLQSASGPLPSQGHSSFLLSDVVAGDLPPRGAIVDQGREAPGAGFRLLRRGDPVEHDLAITGRALLPIGPRGLVPAELRLLLARELRKRLLVS